MNIFRLPPTRKIFGAFLFTLTDDGLRVEVPAPGQYTSCIVVRIERPLQVN